MPISIQFSAANDVITSASASRFYHAVSHCYFINSNATYSHFAFLNTCIQHYANPGPYSHAYRYGGISV